MAFDGSVVHALASELDHCLAGGRIARIAQPEKDELLLTIKAEGRQMRLLLSASPSLPIACLTEESKTSPMNAPAFCMLLRKHLSGGRILSVTQPSMERVLDFTIEHFDEMNDLSCLTLTVEMMGKHSNIILRKDDVILDSIRHVSSLMSSVREVLPGRTYFIPFAEEKLDPFTVDAASFRTHVFSAGSASISKAVYTSLTGFSPMLAEEVLYRAGCDSDRPASSFTSAEQEAIWTSFREVMEQIRLQPFLNIIYFREEPKAFGVFPFRSFEQSGYTTVRYEGISQLLSAFYSQKQKVQSLRQKTGDLRQIITTLLQKDHRKYDLQLRQIRDTEKKDKYRVYGELLTAYGYSVEPKATSFVTEDFYTGETVTIPLDPRFSAVENGKKYFQRYAKLRRTADALNEIVKTTKEEIDHLESILLSLDMVQTPEEIAQIKRELSESGYTGRSGSQNKGPGKKQPKRSEKSSPLHYLSSDGYHIYVGKNNYQNDDLTFRQASANDWWFHAKDIPGSHVLLQAGEGEIPDRAFEEAASLAAHYSASSGSGKVEVQYTLRKNLKKPPGAKPGFVVFHTYYSMAASPDITALREAT